MKEILQTVFKGSEERMKHPLFRAFFTSWIVFNWKSIFFLVFSHKTIENKIKYISHYSDIYILLIYPLISAVFYHLALPYISVYFEGLLMSSTSKRKELLTKRKTEDIKNQSRIAVAEIELEEEKIKFRERNTHNTIVEDLQSKIKSYEEQIDSITKNNNNQIDRLKQENERLLMKERLIIDENERQLAELDLFNKKLREEVEIKDNDISSLRNDLEKAKSLSNVKNNDRFFNQEIINGLEERVINQKKEIDELKRNRILTAEEVKNLYTNKSNRELIDQIEEHEKEAIRLKHLLEVTNRK